MIACLYQRGSWSIIRASVLVVIVEAVFATREAMHRPDRRRMLRRQGYLRLRSSPQCTAIAHQLVHLKRLLFAQSELVQRHLQPHLLGGERINADRDQQRIRAIGLLFPVEQHALILCMVETQIAVLLERRVAAADLVDSLDELADVVGPFEIPGSKLVLLRIEVLFAAGDGARFAPLVAAVDAVGGK